MSRSRERCFAFAAALPQLKTQTRIGHLAARRPAITIIQSTTTDKHHHLVRDERQRLTHQARQGCRKKHRHEHRENVAMPLAFALGRRTAAAIALPFTTALILGTAFALAAARKAACRVFSFTLNSSAHMVSRTFVQALGQRQANNVVARTFSANVIFLSCLIMAFTFYWAWAAAAKSS